MVDWFPKVEMTASKCSSCNRTLVYPWLVHFGNLNTKSRATQDYTNQLTEERRPLKTHLCTAAFLEKGKLEAVRAVRYGVALHPLICVLPSLCADSSYGCADAEVNLKPLSAVPLPCAPWPAVVDSSAPGGQVSVVVRRGGHVTVTNALVFKTEWGGATTYWRTGVALTQICAYITHKNRAVRKIVEVMRIAHAKIGT